MNLVKIRKERGMTQQNVAEAVGVSASAIGNYEQKIREPNIETLKKLATALDVTVDELLKEEDDDKARI